ncbi:bacteriophage T4 gp5 trimerisation domain-containing protein [Noviherbaspirillum album]|uniref:bacteriophage T4 gp5 trimerisation domain-containing protein n=1 Tax=Noviherbaspirillum album TaxID=3080276 RepID=UPI002DD6B198|nr:hypothetical protein [Noviherbaspirillum sp. CPCC 100848]
MIIDYLEGDPDRPICTGRLYNSAQPLPYALPGAAHVMGFKSRSTPGGGGYCEMVIHDKKGQELINIHSQKDMVTTVQHTQATVVNGPHQSTTVTNGFQVTKVKKRVELESQTELIQLKAATEIVLEVGASRIRMEADGKITIQGLHVDVIGTDRIDLNTNEKHVLSPNVGEALTESVLHKDDTASMTQTFNRANIHKAAYINGASELDSLKVDRGQLTFDAEGNDDPKSPYFSRHPHWPGGNSGVTLGRGYDMKMRTPESVYRDLTNAGMSPERAAALAKGALLQGEAAKKFALQARSSLDEISRACYELRK